jgi:hypothetical protein
MKLVYLVVFLSTCALIESNPAIDTGGPNVAVKAEMKNKKLKSIGIMGHYRWL